MNASSSKDTPESPEAGLSTVDGRGAVGGHEQPGLSSAWLLVFERDSTRMVPLPSTGELTIGRAETCDLRLEEHRVSRTHARLTLVDGEGRLADLDSQNGTVVNDDRLVGQRTLSSGDVVVIAGVTLVFHSSRRHARGATFLEPGAFRQRVDVELERAGHFSRPVSMLDVSFNPSPDRPRVVLALEQTLRRVDLASWSASDHLSVLLPEADAAAGRELGLRVLEAIEPVHPGVRAGLSVFSEDGADTETLQSAARAAAASAKFGELALAHDTFQTYQFGGRQVVVADGVMLRLYELVHRLAQSELSLVVHGETGTGKELVAHAVHALSPRAAKRLVTVNCAALSETLLESELFGHERGAFTGATSTKEGLLEASSGGTIFLDEVGEMSPSLQAKLLRALESHRITRVGDTREREVDLRVVAATHRDLPTEVKAGRFREDLFFRLAGATIWLPPLRNRRRELPLLARRFLDEACQKLGKPAPLLSAAATQVLGTYPWPGNVRELRNGWSSSATLLQGEMVERWHLDERLSKPPRPRRRLRLVASSKQVTAATPRPVTFRLLAAQCANSKSGRMVGSPRSPPVEPDPRGVGH